MTQELTHEQRHTIGRYSAWGIDIEPLDDDRVIIKQARLPLGRILLTQRDLVQRAKELFPERHCLPVTYATEIDQVTPAWIQGQMDELGLKFKDLQRMTCLSKDTLKKILSGEQALLPSQRALFFYALSAHHYSRIITALHHGQD